MSAGARRGCVFLACVLVVSLSSACSGGSAKKSAPQSDAEIATSSLLTAADLPGYVAMPRKPASEPSVSVRRKLAACLGVGTTFFDTPPNGQSARSDNFREGEAEVSSEVKIDVDQSELDGRWTAFTKPVLGRCLEAYVESILSAEAATGFTFGKPSIVPFSVGIGTRSLGYRVKVPVTVRRIDPNAYVDIVLIARGRAAISIVADDVDTPFDQATEIRLARIVYDRLGTRAG